MKKVLLYSGGMDSWLIDKLWNPDVKLYVDVKGSYSQQEIDRLPTDVIVERLDIGKFELPDKIIPMRNLFFVMMASFYGDEICLGATNGDRPLDKGREFAERASDLLSFLLRKQRWTDGKEIRVVMPYKDFTKTQLLGVHLANNGDINTAMTQTFSCYSPVSGHECWRCKACVRKAVSFILNGYNFDGEKRTQILSFLAHEKEYIHASNCSRGKEDYETLQAYKLLKEIA